MIIQSCIRPRVYCVPIMPSPTPPAEELYAWLRLAQEPGLSAAQARHLLVTAGLPQHVYALSMPALRKIVPETLAVQLHRAPDIVLAQRIDASLQWLQVPGHRVLTLADPDYPQTLLDLTDPPLLLYVHGNPALLNRPAISIVGARNATADGVDNAHAFAQHLARQGWCVVSGLAHGIDAAAHAGALSAGCAGGGTIAVLGTGVDIVYPASHRDLAHQIAQTGVLVSEFALGSRALPHQFPRRNRLVAAMARGVLVVEAARQSGSLITARHALEVGREVFAIPGSIHSPLSRGCHALIRQGAKLVESARDIQEELGSPDAHPVTLLSPTQKADVPSTNTTPAPDAEAAKVLVALGHGLVDITTLQERTQLPLAALTAQLAALELNDMVVRLVDGRFQRRHRGVAG